MKRFISSLAVMGMCTAMLFTNPISAKGEQIYSFEPNVGAGILLSPQLSDDEKEELLNLAVQILSEKKYKNYSLENARERMQIGEDGNAELGYNNRWGIEELTDEELELLADIVWLESGNQGLIGQELVTVVILNRMVDEYYQGDVEEVLSADGQFTTWKKRMKSSPTDETYEAIENVLSGNADDEILNAPYLYFNTSSGSVKIGDHWFS